jgi:hypothetical protein
MLGPLAVGVLLELGVPGSVRSGIGSRSRVSSVVTSGNGTVEACDWLRRYASAPSLMVLATLRTGLVAVPFTVPCVLLVLVGAAGAGRTFWFESSASLELLLGPVGASSGMLVPLGAILSACAGAKPSGYNPSVTRTMENIPAIANGCPLADPTRYSKSIQDSRILCLEPPRGGLQMKRLVCVHLLKPELYLFLKGQRRHQRDLPSDEEVYSKSRLSSKAKPKFQNIKHNT